MENNQTSSQAKSLNANPKKLHKALAQAAKQASKLAGAFGLKIPSTQESNTKIK